MTGQELRERRNKLNLSQFCVSKAARVSRYKISIFENGYTELEKEEVKRITTFLKKQKEHHNVRNSRQQSKRTT